MAKAALRACAPGDLTRRDVMTFCAAATMAALVPHRADASPEQVAERIAAFSGGGTPEEGRIALDIPELADNGASVPVTIAVESPMTESDHVVAVMIGAEKNPFPVVATFHFSPMSGKATVTTRIRLAETQTVSVVAKMSDGKTYIVRRKVEVTAGGCG